MVWQLTVMTTVGTPPVVMEKAFAQSVVETSVDFHVAAGDLDHALTQAADQSGVHIFFPSAAVTGKRTDGLSGRLAVSDAMARLLNGSGLSWHLQDGRTIVVATNRNPTITLSPVRVQGTASQLAKTTGAGLASRTETATGSVKGYVAHLSASGTKTDTPLIETPQSISVVSRDLISDIGAQSLGQALVYSAGVQTQPYGFDPRYDQPLIRGFSANQYGNYRDGLRFANGSFAYFRNEPYEAERIEVFRGPTSVLYGSNNPGGLTNVVSKLPVDTSIHEVELTLGNYNRYQGEFDLGGAIDHGHDVLYRVTGLFRDSDTQVHDTKDNRIAVAPSMTFHITPRTTLTLLGEYQKNLTSMWPYYLYVPGKGLTHIRVGDPAYDAFRQQQWYFGYKLEHKVSDLVTLRQNFRYGHAYLDGEFEDAYSLLGTNLTRYAGQWQEGLTSLNLDTQAQFNFRSGPVKHTVLFGVDYFQQHLNSKMGEGWGSTLNLLNPVYSTSGVSIIQTATDVYQTINQVGVYAQEQLSWKHWHLLLGGREDMVGTSSRNLLANNATTRTSPNAFTGRASLLYLFDNGIAPYFSYSTSFMPTSGVSSPANGSHPFDPTKGHQYEAGLKYQPHGFDSYITADFFDLHQTNVLTTDPANTVYNIQNGRVRSRGAEVEAVANLGFGLQAIGSYTYVDILNTQSTTAPHKVPVGVPRNQASLFLNYAFPTRLVPGFGVGAGVRFLDKTWANVANTQRNDALTVFDVMTHKDLGPVRLQLNVNNIANRRVAVCNSGNCTWSLDRVVLGSVRVRW
ncbi:TonB-dependent siderophore receptor [Gluconacetobacter sp. Hr-1-5]|uniref:TonB-dependent siderophore receptor n=1 Tax=Gluconacetobacter sp. Hr-1-5 TaxID=3395370 RepID=UPI003B52F4D5